MPDSNPRYRWLTIMVFVVVFACSGQRKDVWIAKAEPLDLLSTLELFPPEDGRFTLRYIIIPSTENSYHLDIRHEVHQRAKGFAGIRITLQNLLGLKIVYLEDGWARVKVTASEISMEPEVIDVIEKMEGDFRKVNIEYRIEDGMMEKRLIRGEEISDEYSNELLEHMQRLTPLYPNREMRVGEQWKMPDISFRRPLPGNFMGNVRRIQGMGEFLGFVEDNGRVLAGIRVRYLLIASGEGLVNDIHGRLSGSGEGGGEFLVALRDGHVVKGQVSEAMHYEVIVTQGTKSEIVEQLSKIFLRFTEEE